LKKLAAQQTIYFTNNELKIGKLPEFQLLFVKLDPYQGRKYEASKISPHFFDPIWESILGSKNETHFFVKK